MLTATLEPCTSILEMMLLLIVTPYVDQKSMIVYSAAFPVYSIYSMIGQRQGYALLPDPDGLPPASISETWYYYDIYGAVKQWNPWPSASVALFQHGRLPRLPHPTQNSCIHQAAFFFVMHIVLTKCVKRIKDTRTPA